jgi:hypothetical protein
VIATDAKAAREFQGPPQGSANHISSVTVATIVGDVPSVGEAPHYLHYLVSVQIGMYHSA